MMFPAIATGKCHLCGSDGLLYDAGGVLHCKRCERGLLEATLKLQAILSASLHRIGHTPARSGPPHG